MANEMINALPGYLATTNVKDSFDTMATFAKPSRIKVVQAQTGPPIKPPFKEGDIIVNPQLIKIGDNEKGFSFSVITFFPSWSCMNPIQMKGSLPSLREMSFDANSTTAKKAKQFTQEACPENPKFLLRYSELLNFFVVIHNEEVQDLPMILFFASAEYKTGQMLIGHIQARKLHFPNVPLFAGRYYAFSEPRNNSKGNWQGLNITNDPTPWVDEQTFAKYTVLSQQLQEIINTRHVDMSEFEVDEKDAADGVF